jgi:glycosyltransferase involved in cell wall biosynthesis
VRKRILISALFFSPYRGSESACGWEISKRLAAHHDVTVITGDLCRDQPTFNDLTQFQAAEGSFPEGMQVEYLAPTAAIHHIHWRHYRIPGMGWLYYWAYNLWQRQAFKKAKALHEAQPFDLTYQLTLTGFREPGYLWTLPIPFVWGPIGGNYRVPAAFLPELGAKEWLAETARKGFGAWQSRRSGRPAQAAKAAHTIWAGTLADLKLTQKWGVDAQCLSESGCNLTIPAPKSPGNNLRLTWCGQILRKKALPLALKALAQCPNTTLDIIGTGCDETQCQLLCTELGLDDRVTWHGWVDHHVSKDIIAKNDALIHTSLKEGGNPHVIMEALSCGVPIICHDTAGMQRNIDATCGIKIPLVDPQTSINGFSEAITKLADPTLRGSLSEGAFARASELTWDKLADQILQKIETI